MTPQGQLTTSALQALIRDGTLIGSWTLDAARSEVLLETRHTWGLRPVHGVFRQVAGNGTVTAAGQVTGTLTVAAGSIDTKSKMRDKDLRSAKIFDADHHPDITYTVEGMQADAGGVHVTGRLTVRDRTHPLSFDATVSAASGESGITGLGSPTSAVAGSRSNPLRSPGGPGRRPTSSTRPASAFRRSSSSASLGAVPESAA